jgi:hypothetical protein
MQRKRGGQAHVSSLARVAFPRRPPKSRRRAAPWTHPRLFAATQQLTGVGPPVGCVCRSCAAVGGGGGVRSYQKRSLFLWGAPTLAARDFEAFEPAAEGSSQRKDSCGSEKVSLPRSAIRLLPRPMTQGTAPHSRRLHEPGELLVFLLRCPPMPASALPTTADQLPTTAVPASPRLPSPRLPRSSPAPAWAGRGLGGSTGASFVRRRPRRVPPSGSLAFCDVWTRDSRKLSVLKGRDREIHGTGLPPFVYGYLLSVRPI